MISNIRLFGFPSHYSFNIYTRLQTFSLIRLKPFAFTQLLSVPCFRLL